MHKSHKFFLAAVLGITVSNLAVAQTVSTRVEHFKNTNELTVTGAIPIGFGSVNASLIKTNNINGYGASVGYVTPTFKFGSVGVAGNAALGQLDLGNRPTNFYQLGAVATYPIGPFTSFVDYRYRTDAASNVAYTTNRFALGLEYPVTKAFAVNAAITNTRGSVTGGGAYIGASYKF